MAKLREARAIPHEFTPPDGTQALGIVGKAFEYPDQIAQRLMDLGSIRLRFFHEHPQCL
jgi:hypothetical protein